MAPQNLDSVLHAGVRLLAILFNTFLFGVISQQLYAYSLSGFKDSMRIKVFVGVQYTIIAFQGIMLWQLAWWHFVADYGVPRNFKARTWQVPVVIGCQCVLVLSANIFLADRVHALTGCRIKSSVIIALSIGAFGFGVALTMLAWFGGLSPNGTYTHPEIIIAAFWHGLQAITGCLIAYFLLRALINSRKKSDGIVYYLIRRVFQIGFFAMLWAALGLVAFIFFPRVCSLFDMTLGSIYTHVIFDTLQSESRIGLRENIAERSQCGMALTAQSPSRTFDTSRKGASVSPGTTHSNASVLSMANPCPGLETTHHSTYRTSKDNVSEVECAPVGQPGVHYEFSYAHFLGEV
ncbi:hypothetical protein H4582DRAFT_229086 [Lactarius indigo]|nr:hypothetical protein H4582DRAFT_229086 [Lactarius indigo]